MKHRKKRIDGAAIWTPFQVNQAMSTPEQVIVFNSIYTVFIRKFLAPKIGVVVHLSVKRNDKEPIHDWRDLQLIKNQLVGKHVTAVEIYPDEAHVVDTANQYHLWCLMEAVLPFGFNEGRFITGESGPTVFGESKQRPFAAHHRPADLAELETEFTRRLTAATQRDQTRAAFGD